MVPEEGLEPSRGATPTHFECAASADSATPAGTKKVYHGLPYCRNGYTRLGRALPPPPLHASRAGVIIESENDYWQPEMR